jgi:hypothetical protein
VGFSLLSASRQALAPTQPPLQWVPEGLPPGVRRSGREADHLRLVLKNARVLMALCLVKQRTALPLPFTITTRISMELVQLASSRIGHKYGFHKV